MSARPGMTAIGVAGDVDACRRLLGDGLGMPAELHEQPDGGRALSLTAHNGAVVIIEPAEANGRDRARWVGVVAGVPRRDARALLTIWHGVAGPCVAVAAEDDAGLGVDGEGVSVAIDHIAFSVPDRAAARDALPAALTGADAPDLGRWEFPALGAATEMVGMRDGYLEFNEPTVDDSYFAATDGGGRPLFVVLRVPDVAAAREALLARGHRVADMEHVMARPEGSDAEPSPIARVAAISRRECSGLAVMIIETRWPWSHPGVH